ncbi:YdcF family protein [Bifidobacterium aquikefiricola]|uniref:YdcF family protein n=1 Tax=Bifidobacterium aquikefiricola TaxID=3059038 RepID=A0AB39U9J9_9BIFI
MNPMIGIALLYAPVLLFGGLFIYSLWREPRQFRNSIYLSLFLICLATNLLMGFGQEWMILPILAAITICPIIVIVFLGINSIVVARHEGLSRTTMLPALLAFAIVLFFIAFPLLTAMHAPRALVSIAGLIVLEGIWFFFTFTALLAYSWIYRLLPKRRRYDYIIIHGAGLQGTEPTPLLKGRIDKAVRLWKRQQGYGKFIASGGQGADEQISEAEAMNRYLQQQCKVPAEAILLEDRSTTTMENLEFSKSLITEHSGGHDYRCALVTSDYHVFRAAEYAHMLHLKADGVGSHTKSYYWPTAFIREFVAISIDHRWPYIVIACIWLISLLLQTFGPALSQFMH